MSVKTDREKLAGIVEQFDPAVATEVLNRYVANDCAPAYKRTIDFPDPGPALAVPAVEDLAPETLDQFERIIGRSNLMPVAFLEEGVRAAKAVARIAIKSSYNPMGNGWGTGSLVSNRLLLTNNHVISSVAQASQMLIQFNYQVDMDGVAQPVDTWTLNPSAFFYTNVALDFTLVAVKGKIFFPPLLNAVDGQAVTINAATAGAIGPVGPVGPIVMPPLDPKLFTRYPGHSWGFLRMVPHSTYAGGQLLNIIQHPDGRMKEVALQENTLTQVYADRIHYVTDTEPGSSGSPVFDNLWRFIALHHSAGHQDSNGQWLDNEGLRMDSIVSHLKAQFATSNPALLAELQL